MKIYITNDTSDELYFIKAEQKQELRNGLFVVEYESSHMQIETSDQVIILDDNKVSSGEVIEKTENDILAITRLIVRMSGYKDLSGRKITLQK